MGRSCDRNRTNARMGAASYLSSARLSLRCLVFGTSDSSHRPPPAYESRQSLSLASYSSGLPGPYHGPSRPSGSRARHGGQSSRPFHSLGSSPSSHSSPCSLGIGSFITSSHKLHVTQLRL